MLDRFESIFVILVKRTGGQSVNPSNPLKQNAEEPMLYSIHLDRVRCGAKFGPRIHNNYIIECNESGYGSVIINGVEFAVKPRQCYVIMPGQVITYTADSVDPRNGISCCLGGSRIGQMLGEIGITENNPYVREDLFDEITSLVYKMYEIKSETDRGAEFRRIACIYELLGVLARSKPSHDSEFWVRKAIGIFEAEYNRNISVSDIATAVGFERSYFSTIFRERMGVSPHVYLNSLRISKACILLRESNSSIAEIAENVGIDPVNFARIFKREKGISPLEYRRGAKK